MASKDRRERERTELRTRIIDAARRMIVSEGCEALSMRKIAEAIEYSPTAIYDYFKDKHALIREICRMDFASLASMAHALSAVEDPIERIRQLGYGYIRFAVEHPEHYRLMFMTPHKPGPAPEDLEHKGDPEQVGYAALTLAVAQAMKQGRFRDDLKSVELIAQVFWAAVHGVASLQITHDDSWVEWTPLDDRIRTTVDGILTGLARRGSQ
jgi:AcrR family transcriptional regulator